MSKKWIWYEVSTKYLEWKGQSDEQGTWIWYGMWKFRERHGIK